MVNFEDTLSLPGPLFAAAVVLGKTRYSHIHQKRAFKGFPKRPCCKKQTAQIFLEFMNRLPVFVDEYPYFLNCVRVVMLHVTLVLQLDQALVDNILCRNTHSDGVSIRSFERTREHGGTKSGDELESVGLVAVVIWTSLRHLFLT